MNSFARKIDARTSRDSQQKRGAEWIVAGSMTQQFLSEIEDDLNSDDAKDDAQDDNYYDYVSASDLHSPWRSKVKRTEISY